MKGQARHLTANGVLVKKLQQVWENRPEGWLEPTLLFAVQRVLLSGLGLALYALGRVPLTEDPVTRPYFGIPPEVEGMSGALLGVWQRFDVIHFLRIARDGYAQADLSAFFPLFPMATKLLGLLLGDRVLLASFLVANLCTLLAVNALYFWMLDEGHDRSAASAAILFLIWFPTAFFLFVPYSESLFLLCAVAALWSIRRRRWALAGAAAVLATLTRLAGVMLAPVLIVGWAAARDRSSASETALAAVSAAMPGVAFAGLSVWRSTRAFPSLVESQASYWHRLPAFPWQGVTRTVERIAAGSASAVEFLDLLVVLAMLAAGIVVIRRLPLSLSAYHWGVLLLGLSQIRVGQPLSGQARFAVVLVPAFIVLGEVARGPVLKRAVAYSFLGLHLFLAGQFIMWGWVG